MAADGKTSNKITELIGKFKHVIGRLTGNRRLREEGLVDQRAGRLRQARHHLSKAAHRVLGR